MSDGESGRISHCGGGDLMMQRVVMWMAIAAMMTALAGCAQKSQTENATAAPKPEMKTAPATPIAEKKEELTGDAVWRPEWDEYVEQALPAEMLTADVARDVRRFCPRFATMSETDKRQFWAYFFQALAGAEAGLKPTTDVRHTEPEVAKKDAVSGRMIRSEGLLQLTYMDGQRYGCDFDWEKDKSLPEKDPSRTILQPKNNLECGVKILDNQLITKHEPLLTHSSYWSTLQPGRPSYRVFAKQMANVPESCKLPAGSKKAAVPGRAGQP
jgi:hypothetical protein